MRGGRSLDLDFSGLGATPRTGLEGLQTAINQNVTLLDKYLERESAREEREANKALEQQRYDVAQRRLDTQEAWQRQKYDEEKTRQVSQDKINAEDRAERQRLATKTETRQDLLFKQQQEALDEEKAKKAATDKFTQNFYGIADKAVLDTTAGQKALGQAQVALVDRAAKETQALAAADAAYFGIPKTESMAYNTPQASNITDYGEQVANTAAIKAAKPVADRSEMVRAMSPQLVGTNIDVTNLPKSLEGLGIGRDTEALAATADKQDRELASKLFTASNKGLKFDPETGTFTGKAEDNGKLVSLLPTNVSPKDGGWGFDSSLQNLQEAILDANKKDPSNAIPLEVPRNVQSKLITQLIKNGALKPEGDVLVEGSALGPEVLRTSYKQALELAKKAPEEAEDPLSRYNDILARIKESRGGDLTSTAVNRSILEQLGSPSRNLNTYSGTTPLSAPENVSTAKQTSLSNPKEALKPEYEDTEKLKVGALQEYLNKPTNVPSKEVLQQAAQIARDRGTSEQDIKYLVDVNNVQGLLDYAARKGSSQTSRVLRSLGEGAANIGQAGTHSLKELGSAAYGLVKPTGSAATIAQATEEARRYLNADQHLKNIEQNEKNIKDLFLSKQELLGRYGLQLPQPKKDRLDPYTVPGMSRDLLK